MKKVILLIILLLFIPCVHAYENNYFSIELNNNYKEKTNKDREYLYTYNNDYISITISDNKDNYNVSKFTEKDINKQKEYIEKEYLNKLSKYTSNIQVTNMNLNSNKKQYYLEYDLFYDTKTSIGYNLYQRCRMYTTNNYVYLIVYNTDKEIDNTLYNDLISTFKIKDNYLRKINITLYSILLIVLFILIIVFNYLLNKKRRN